MDIKLYAFHPGESLIAIIVLCAVLLFLDWRIERRQDQDEKRSQELLKNWGKKNGRL